MQSVEPVLENAIKTLQKVVDVRDMGKKTRYHAIRRASPRERHQDPPKGRRCQRYGKEVSSSKLNTISDLY